MKDFFDDVLLPTLVIGLTFFGVFLIVGLIFDSFADRTSYSLYKNSGSVEVFVCDYTGNNNYNSKDKFVNCDNGNRFQFSEKESLAARPQGE